MKRLAFVLFLFAFSFAVSPRANADSFGVYGDTTTVAPTGTGAPGLSSVWQLASDPSLPNMYSGVYWTAPAGLTLGDIISISAEYNFTSGSFANGAPRYSVWQDPAGNQEALTYWSPANTNPNSNGTWGTNTEANTNTTLNTNTSGAFGSSSGINYPFVDWATLVSDAGSTTPVSVISVDLDGDYGGAAGAPEYMQLADFTIQYDLGGQITTVVGPAALVSSTPESSTSLLLLAGLGALAATVLLRRRAATAAGVAA